MFIKLMGQCVLLAALLCRNVLSIRTVIHTPMLAVKLIREICDNLVIRYRRVAVFFVQCPFSIFVIVSL